MAEFDPKGVLHDLRGLIRRFRPYATRGPVCRHAPGLSVRTAVPRASELAHRGPSRRLTPSGGPVPLRRSAETLRNVPRISVSNLVINSPAPVRTKAGRTNGSIERPSSDCYAASELGEADFPAIAVPPIRRKYFDEGCPFRGLWPETVGFEGPGAFSSTGRRRRQGVWDRRGGLIFRYLLVNDQDPAAVAQVFGP